MEEAVPEIPRIPEARVRELKGHEELVSQAIKDKPDITLPELEQVTKLELVQIDGAIRRLGEEVVIKTESRMTPGGLIPSSYRLTPEAIAKPPTGKTEEWKLRVAIADTVYGLAHGVKEEDIRRSLTRNPRAKYWFEPEDVDYILKEAKREVAGPKLESVVEYDRRYTLEELREMAKQEGLSPSGSKKEIAARLIARGVK